MLYFTCLQFRAGWLPVRGWSGPDRGPPPSVYLHSSVDLADKHVGCIEADGAREEPEGQDHEGRVAKVEERGNEFDDVQLGHKRGEKGDTLSASLLWPTRCPLTLSQTSWAGSEGQVGRTARVNLHQYQGLCSVLDAHTIQMVGY